MDCKYLGESYGKMMEYSMRKDGIEGYMIYT